MCSLEYTRLPRIDSTPRTRKEPLKQPPQLLYKNVEIKKSQDDKSLKCILLNPGSLGPQFSPDWWAKGNCKEVDTTELVCSFPSSVGPPRN